jgi:branched-chain amino acid transport system substrate-binding protein
MKKIIWIVVIIVLFFATLGYLQKGMKRPGVSNTNEPIKLAFIGPLTGDGAAWGEIEKNTIQLAVDEINSNGGVKGRQINVAYEDGKCEGPAGLTAAKKLVEVDQIGILLVSCSQEILPIAPYAEQNKVIALTSYASASQITNAGSYIFRNSYNNHDMARAMAEIAIKKGSEVAIITEQSAFAADLGDLFVKEALPAVKGTIVVNESFEQGVKDYRAQITKIIAANPQVVVLNPTSPATGVALLKQFRQLGYKGPFVGNFFGGSTEVQALSEAQGMVYVSDPVFSESPLKQKVFAAYEQKYGKAPELPWPVGARYDAVYLLKQAFETVGTNPTAVRDYLHNLPQDFTGVLGTYRFNKDNADITNVKPSIAIIQNKKSEPYKP